MIVLYMKLKLLDMQTNVNGTREKDDRNVSLPGRESRKIIAKKRKEFKNSEKLAVKSNFFAIFAFRKQCSGLSLAFSTGGCERKVRAA